MSRGLTPGLLLALVQMGLVAALGGKFLYDRATLPRVWALTLPVDPELPIRGRYVRLRVVVETPDIPLPETREEGSPNLAAPAVRLAVVDGDLVAMPVAEGADGLGIVYLAGPSIPALDPESGEDDEEGHDEENGEEGEEGEEKEQLVVTVLQDPVAFFIPENVPDPSWRAPGESLWVELTVPRRGPPRPIRLGVQKDDGPIVPLSVATL